jgi:hypothetical protein
VNLDLVARVARYFTDAATGLCVAEVQRGVPWSTP